MLNPDTTVLLTDALQPPPGYRVDTAVATTYSLHLTAMLVAPMTFALADVGDAATLGGEDSVQLLDAVQRYMGSTTVFCQAAGIHVPATHSRIHTFLEGSIHQVEPRSPDSLFHPKMWAIRYARDEDGAQFHRVVVASRNLTLDSSWDTALVLDESPRGTIDAAPAAEFVSRLPGTALDPLPEERVDAIADLGATLQAVQLEAPEPFTGGSLLPLGLGRASSWPFDGRVDRLLAISPFVTAGTLARLRVSTSDATLLTRAESADQVGAAAAADWDLQVLHSSASIGDAPEEEASAADAGEFGGIRTTDAEAPTTELTGLHAKTVVTDLPSGESRTVTGSANLTAAGWGRNVEFDAILTGPTATCGVQAVLGRDDTANPGLQTIMRPYTPTADDPTDDPAIATGYELEAFHRELARSQPRPRLDIVPSGDDRVSARLTLVLPAELVGDSEIWLSTVPGQRRPLAGQTDWEVAVENITPFVAIETTAGTGDARATRRRLLMVPIVGDVLERRQRALAAMLNSRDRMLRYLAFLLGIDDATGTVAAREDEDESIDMPIDGAPPAGPHRAEPLPIALFEPLVRAVGRDVDRLAAIAEQIDDLRKLPDADRWIPPEFLQMWDVVLQVVTTRRSA